MGLSNRDIYLWRTRATKIAQWCIGACALVGGLGVLAMSCSHHSTPQTDDELARYAVAAMHSFLHATNNDPGLAADYFPGTDFANTELPPIPVDAATVTAGDPKPHGADTWQVPVTVISATGETSSWHLDIAATDTGYVTTQLPSPWPGATTGTQPPTTATQTLDPDHPAATAASDFLTAWLTPDGQPGRYTTAADVAPPWPTPPYNAIDVAAIRTNQPPPEKPSGTLTVHADVVTASRYHRQVGYVLRLKAVDDQWMVAAINPPAQS